MGFSSVSAKLSVMAIALVASALAMGCSDTVPGTGATGVTAGTNPNAGPVPTGFSLTCNVALKTSTFQFEANSSTLTMKAPGASEVLGRATGTSGSDVYGTWVLPITLDGDPSYIARMGLAIHATAIITPTSITTSSDCSSNWATIHARVTSPISISGDNLSILESHEQFRKWTSAGGDQVVSTTSFRPFGEPEATSNAVLGATFPAF